MDIVVMKTGSLLGATMYLERIHSYNVNYISIFNNMKLEFWFTF